MTPQDKEQVGLPIAEGPRARLILARLNANE